MVYYAIEVWRNAFPIIYKNCWYTAIKYDYMYVSKVWENIAIPDDAAGLMNIQLMRVWLTYAYVQSIKILYWHTRIVFILWNYAW